MQAHAAFPLQTFNLLFTTPFESNDLAQGETLSCVNPIPPTNSNVQSRFKATAKRSFATSVQSQKTLSRATPSGGRGKMPASEFRPRFHASRQMMRCHRHARRIEILTNKGNPTPE